MLMPPAAFMRHFMPFLCFMPRAAFASSAMLLRYVDARYMLCLR